LISNGYEPLPCNGKRPAAADWANNPVSTDPKHDGCNTGLLTRYTPALDIDLDDEIAVYSVTELAGAVLKADIGRLGRPPRILIPFRTATPFKKMRLDVRKGEQRGAIEWLGDGQQFVAFGVHPGTGLEYEWLDPSPNSSPLDTPRDALPEVDEALARDFLRKAGERLEALGYTVSRPAAGKSIRQSEAYVDFKAPDDADPLLVEALHWLCPDDYDSWIAAGHALKAAGEGNLELWRAWSAASDKYDPAVIDGKWSSFQPHRAGAYSLLRAAGMSTAALDFEPAEQQEAEAGERLRARERLVVELGDSEGLEPVRYLIKGVLQADTVGVSAGRPGAFKSFIAFDRAMCVAFGVKYHGRNVMQGPVYIIAGEGRNGILRRINAWKLRHGVTESNKGRVYISPRPLVLNDGGLATAKAIKQEIDEIEADLGVKFLLVLVDTLARAFKGNENAQEDMGEFVRACDTLRNGDRVVYVVHHVNKQGDLRGSSVLPCAADWIEYVERKERSMLVTVKTLKVKEGPEPPPYSLRAEVVVLGETVDQWGDPETVSSLVFAQEFEACVDTDNLPPLTDDERAVRDYLRECDGQAFRKDVLDHLEEREKGRNQPRSRKALGCLLDRMTKVFTKGPKGVLILRPEYLTDRVELCDE
jgi:hypothetical protein